MTGHINFLARSGRFGIVRGSDKINYFFHISQVRDRDEVCVDEQVRFDVHVNPERTKPEAVNIRITVPILSSRNHLTR